MKHIKKLCLISLITMVILLEGIVGGRTDPIIRQEKYEIQIETDFTSEPNSYLGHARLLIACFENTRQIILHKEKQIMIKDEVKAKEVVLSTPNNNEIFTGTLDRKSAPPNYIIIHFQKDLQAGKTYEISVLFEKISIFSIPPNYFLVEIMKNGEILKYSQKPMDLYYTPGSAPCRSIMMTANVLGIRLNLIRINLFEDEHKKPEMLKINPQHTIPTLVDGDFTLWESHAIMPYLVKKYAENDLLYPENTEKQAVVLRLLSFDATVLNQAFTDAYYPLISKGIEVTKEKIEKLDEALGFLNLFLDGNEYVAGKHLTIADLCLVATVTTIQAVDYSINKFPNVVKWLEKVKSDVPDYENTNADGARKFHEYYLSSVAKHKNEKLN